VTREAKDADYWASKREVANIEPIIDRFIRSVGGARLDERFGPLTSKNADYIFEEQRVVIELKILETEFGNTRAFSLKEDALRESMARKFGLGPILRGENGPLEFYANRKAEIYRAPLSRIAKRANRQIRETKAVLGLGEYRGILLCMNDNFRQIGVDLVLHLFGRILIGGNSEIEAIVYLTNHYVALPGNNYANLLWVPFYQDETKDLPEFVNWLGREWFNFLEKETGPPDNRVEGADIDISGARPILSSLERPKDLQ
jgi:hypothetical protein